MLEYNITPTQLSTSHKRSGNGSGNREEAETGNRNRRRRIATEATNMEDTRERHNQQPRYQLGEKKKPSWEPKITDKSKLVDRRK